LDEGEGRKSLIILVGKSEGKRSLGTAKRRQEDDIEILLKV
jgi:hypothetical protein